MIILLLPKPLGRIVEERTGWKPGGVRRQSPALENYSDFILRRLSLLGRNSRNGARIMVTGSMVHATSPMKFPHQAVVPARSEPTGTTNGVQRERNAGEYRVQTLLLASEQAM